MKESSDFEFDDLQGLLRFGYGKLTDTFFMLLNIINADLAKKWLETASVNAITQDLHQTRRCRLPFPWRVCAPSGWRNPLSRAFPMSSSLVWQEMKAALAAWVMSATMRRNSGNGGQCGTGSACPVTALRHERRYHCLAKNHRR